VSAASRPTSFAKPASKPASGPRTASSHTAPVSSPARGMVGKIAQAFTGRSGAAAAAAPSADSWEEF
ncbi:hypothetical protein, partial [Neorhizobium lilium]|uniref:hypothetical protein n=1 Tax=Neorhizobium lilium TaxID=2503024 RepID=UPI0013E2CB23